MALPKTPTIMSDKHPFLLSVEEVAAQLNTNTVTGLSARKVQELQRECPPNALEGGGGASAVEIFIKQLTNAMILVRVSLYLSSRSN